MMKFLAYLVCYCAYPFSFLIPRSKKKWAFGSFRGAFNDNAKYLFIHVSETEKEIRCAWLGISRNTVREVRAKGLKAYHVLSPKGLWFALTSKFWFYNAYSSDIMFCLSGGATLVNLWHGLPLKRIEFDIDSGPLADRFMRKTLKERYYHPEVFKRPDYVLSSSELFSEVFARSFRIPTEHCLGFNYPRNEILLWPKEKIQAFVERYESDESRMLLAEMEEYDTVYIYLPTWRDSQSNFVVDGFDFRAMDATMRASNSLFLLKPHANHTIDSSMLEGLTHVKLLPGTMDVYPILPYTDVLITDYSSVMYDYLLMQNKGVILYLFDFQAYEKERSFVWPFDEMTVGRKAYDFGTLLEYVRNGVERLDEVERKNMVQKCWGDDPSRACEKLELFFKQA